MSVNEKITYAAEVSSPQSVRCCSGADVSFLQVQSVLRQLLTEVHLHYPSLLKMHSNPPRQSSGHRMELIIIALIAVRLCQPATNTQLTIFVL